MRKTQLALAAVALVASTAAMATEVKISGQFDVGLVSTNKNAAGANGGTFMEQSGLMDHSSITFNISEDLGSGLKAFVVLESGFNANGWADNGGTNGATQATGSNPTTLFNRQSLIGLSSDSLGSVALGKQLSPFILSQVLTNFGVGSFWVNRLAVGAGGAGGNVSLVGSDGTTAGFFIPNAITYTSPSIGGVTALAMTTTRNGTQGNAIYADDATSSARFDSVSLSGNVGSAFVSAAWQQRKDSYKSWTVGGTMPVMEGLTLMANYINDKAEGSDAVKSWAVGGKYALMAGTDAILQYATNSEDGNAKRTLTNLTFTHALSKRTTAYATVAQAKNQGAALGNFGQAADYAGMTNKIFGLGVAHSF